MSEKKIQKKNRDLQPHLSRFGVVNFPIGDFLIQIKNAALARNREIEVRKTKLILNVAELLKKEGYLEEVKDEGDSLSVKLTYRRKEPMLLNIKIVSKPGLRIYKKADELLKERGPSIFIISTPEGILTSKEAVKKRVGGEVLAEIL